MPKTVELKKNIDGEVIYPKTVQNAIIDLQTIPSKTSELTNDSGFVTLDTVYSKSEIDEMIGEGVVFVADYGVTPYADISDAYDDGKVIFVKDGIFRIPLTVKAPNRIFYFGGVSSSNYMWWCYINPSNGWVHTGYYIEDRSNKTNTITGNESSSTYYPTTKAVADHVSGVVGDINEVLDGLNGGDSGAFSNLYKMGVVSQTLTWDSTDNSYSVSNVLTGYIPVDFINNITDAGATFDTTTGYFSLNGITNIAYDEMREIYSHRVAYGANTVLPIFGAKYKARTNFTVYWGCETTYYNHVPTTVYNKYLAYKNASITKFAFSDTLICVRADSVNNFASNSQGSSQIAQSRIEEIIGIIDVSNLTGNANFFYNGDWMPWLTTFSIKNLNASINLIGMPKLSVATVKYMIVNAMTTTITITLNATCYDNIINDSEIVSALESKTNVTLAKAS